MIEFRIQKEDGVSMKISNHVADKISKKQFTQHHKVQSYALKNLKGLRLCDIKQHWTLFSVFKIFRTHSKLICMNIKTYLQGNLKNISMSNTEKKESKTNFYASKTFKS